MMLHRKINVYCFSGLFLCPLFALSALDSSKGASSTYVTRDCAECPEMVSVILPWAGATRSLMVARYELTWKEYLVAYNEAKCSPPRNIDGKPINLAERDLRDNFPMTSIKPDEFDCYLRWIRQKTGKPYRLPTEAEWVAIARKATGLTSMPAKELPADNGYLLGRSHNEWGYTNGDPRRSVDRKTVWRVGQFKPDKLGLYDLFGNAAEAVADTDMYISQQQTHSARRGTPVTIVKGGDISYGSKINSEFDLINDKGRYLSSANSSTVGFRVIYDGEQ